MRSFDPRERRREAERAEAALAAVDRALETGEPHRGDRRERELGHLALALRTGAPRPRGAFEAELERRVRAGFANGRSDAARRAHPAARRGAARAPARLLDRLPGGAATSGRRVAPKSRGRRIAAPAVAVLVGAVGALVLGVGVIAGGVGGIAPDSSRVTTLPAERGGGERTVPTPGGREEAPLADPVAPTTQDGRIAPQAPDRHVERSAEVALETAPERVGAVASAAIAVTARHRGFVMSSSTYSSEEHGAGGSLDLRIPSDRLRPAVTDLARLATVRSQSEAGSDITAPVETTADRLDAARAERRSLLDRLANAQSDREATALRARLRLVAGEVRGLSRQLEALRERADYARVVVTLTDGSTVAPLEGDSTGAAVEGAFDSLVAAVNVAIRALGILIPLAVVAGLGWLVWRALRRRHREAVLE